MVFDFAPRNTGPGIWTRRVAFVGCGAAAGVAYTFWVASWFAADLRGKVASVLQYLGEYFGSYLDGSWYYYDSFSPSDLAPLSLTLLADVLLLAALWLCIGLRRRTGSDEARSLRRIGILQALAILALSCDHALRLLEGFTMSCAMCGWRSPYCPYRVLVPGLVASVPALVLLLVTTAPLAGRRRWWFHACGWWLHVAVTAVADMALLCWLWLEAYI